MESNAPGGAVDNDFDDAARDGRTVLQEALAEFPRTIERGDIVIDLVQGRPLYVRRTTAPTAAEYFDSQDFDLTTYKAHPWLPVGPDDPIYECVFIPTKPQDIPSTKGDKSYDYPRGRLARVPVEWLYDGDAHRHAEQVITTLSYLFESTDGAALQATANVAVNVFGEEWVDTALEVAGFDPSDYDRDVAIDFYADADFPDDEAPEDDADPKGSDVEDTDDGDELGDFEP